ncbi:MAG: efflux RND transporter periplasmic adaptor subunit [bacterium]|nr:efflux RND transporter periplasmic adaptor subunit [bacterium]
MRTICLLVALATIVTAGTGCKAIQDAIARMNGGEDTESEQKAPPRVVIPVEAERPERADISAYFETNARVTAEKEVNIIPEAAEKCLTVNVDEGDRVKKGDILAELDTRNLQTQISEQETQVSKQRADSARAKAMADEGIGAPVEYDNAQFALKQGEAALSRLRLQLRNLTLRAPITGIVTMRNIQVGQLVATGSPVFTMVDPTSYILVINPPEQEAGRLRVGQMAKVKLDAVAEKEFDARVRRISPYVDKESGTVKVTLDFEQDIMSQLLYAAFARVSLVMETRENVLLVPKDAVVEEGPTKYLFVLIDEDEAAEAEAAEAAEAEAEGESEDESEAAASEDAAAPETGAPEEDKEGTSDVQVFVAERVQIETGLEDSASIEVVKGIDEDAMIVTLGQQSLKPGSFVKVTNAEAELLAKAGLTADEALAAAQKKRDAGARDVQRRRGF